MIDPSAFIARGAIVLGDVRLEARTSLWYNAVVRGDTERIVIGDESNIQDLTMIHADPGYPCLIGRRVTVGHRVILHGCTIEDECMIGMGAVVLNGAHVGRGSVVGAGAVVVESTIIPPGSLVLGIPARVARPVEEAMRRRIDHAWRHYVDQADAHRRGTFPIRPTSEAGFEPAGEPNSGRGEGS